MTKRVRVSSCPRSKDHILYGLRSSLISSKLDVAAFPPATDKPTCICEDVDEDEQTNQLIDDLDGLSATGGT